MREKKVNKHCKWIFVLYVGTKIPFHSQSDLNMKSQTVKMNEKISLKKSLKWNFNVFFFWKRFLNEFYHSVWVATRFLFCLAKYVIRGINVILVCIDFCCLYAHSKKNILYQKALNVFNVLKFKQNCLDTTSHHR